MIKYIKVNWPDYQEFMELPEFNECFYCVEDDSYFIPEYLYNKTLSYFRLPDKYKDRFTIEFNKINRGQKVLVETSPFKEWKVEESAVNWKVGDCLPPILKNPTLLDGVNCTIIAVEK